MLLADAPVLKVLTAPDAPKLKLTCGALVVIVVAPIVPVPPTVSVSPHAEVLDERVFELLLLVIPPAPPSTSAKLLGTVAFPLIRMLPVSAVVPTTIVPAAEI